MATCLIGLGSNLGAREEFLQSAVAQLSAHPRVARVVPSRFVQTAPVGGPPGQAPFLNAAAIVETSLEPRAVFAVLQAIERRLGRVRHERWAARSVDLDLLLYDDAVLAAPELTVPHPRMAWRRFVLEPAVEIAAHMVHPVIGWSIARLWEHLRTARPYAAVAGGIAAGKTELAKVIAAQSPTRWIVEPIDAQLLSTFYRDPAQQAWHTELELLGKRTALLRADRPEWRAPGDCDPGDWVVSDFWFDQSLAFASVWLAPDRQAEFRRLWEEARRQVVRPKLIVLLDAPADVLHRRMIERGRQFELDLSAGRLEQIRQAVVDLTLLPDQGPVLALDSVSLDAARQEVQAALESMR